MSLRLPAEWEPHSFTQITWPSLASDWAYMIRQVERCYVDIVKAVTRFEPLLIVTDDVAHVKNILADFLSPNVFFFECPTNDTWARDHGFLTLVDDNGNATLADFQFNGWGMKFAADKDNLINQKLFKSLLNDNLYQNNLSHVLEGGSIETDGRGTILTTTNCLMAPNRNWFTSKAEAEELLKKTLHCQRVLWVDHGLLTGDDTDGHVDTLVRFAPDDTIVYVEPPLSTADEQYEELLAMQSEVQSLLTPDGRPYRLVPLPCTPQIDDQDDGTRLPATYANFYFVNGAILVPTYGVHTDVVALARLSHAFPAYEVVGVDCSALIRQHGSLHCSTMQFNQSVKLNTHKCQE
ncbi:MAG: agmatine deiminase family protein [Bacteroidales bacterium]|nr:agmatine deiminase family protein [Bacteroidales bacterium]